MHVINDINALNDAPKNSIFKKGNRYHDGVEYSDNIYTFDIEVTSLFKINGKWQRFNYDITDYSDIDKASCVYICMLGINDEVYYFRDFSMFEQILIKLSDKYTRKIFYIHNLAYEMQFMRMFLHKYTIENMLASAPHKPIAFYIKELNIEFRCSYRLTNLSLDKSAEKYTNIRKKTGDLNYNIERSPLTKLTDTELSYCEYDIKTLYEIIKYFRTEYKHIYNIPLTQTAEVRRDLLHRLDFFYFKKQKEYIPDYETFIYLMQAFQGGITHANFIWSGKVLKNVYSADEASAYPTMLLTKKYPCGKWRDFDIQDYEHLQDEKAFMFHVKLYNVKSKLFNHYISTYKCINKADAYADNGRLISASYIEMIITDCDFEMIKQSYTYDRIDYVRILGCNKKYLDKRILQYILDLYKQKTELKGIEEQQDFYMKSKQRINSIFGCACTNPLNQDTYYKNNEWGRYCNDGITEDFIKDKIASLQNATNYFQFSTGVYCTAYNRATIWAQIIKNDKKVVYYDTDSIKSLGKIDFTEYNEQIQKECEQSALANGLNIDDFAPLDKKGVAHPCGLFEQETPAQEFITLGAKKYCCRYDDGLHLTVSGVTKKAVKGLKDDIRNFNTNMIFNYEDAQKNIHYYTQQEAFTFTDIDGNNYTCNDTYGIVLQPTTYTLNVTRDYAELIQLHEGAQNE